MECAIFFVSLLDEAKHSFKTDSYGTMIKLLFTYQPINLFLNFNSNVNMLANHYSDTGRLYRFNNSLKLVTEI